MLSPVDSFLLAKLESKGLSFSPEADRYTCIRRAYLDLAGPASLPEEVDTFLADDHPGAFERLVDRLLASPHFGERWGGTGSTSPAMSIPSASTPMRPTSS